MKKKLLPILVIIAMLLQMSFTSTPVYGEGDGEDGEGGVILEGSGTEGDPYQIDDPALLALIANNVNTGVSDFDGVYFALTEDLDLTGSEWVPIGDADHPFMGSFDGDGHVITGMHIGTVGSPNSAIGYLGLFGHTGSNSSIHDVTIENGSIYTTYAAEENPDGNYIGLLVGYADEGEVDDCHVSGTIVCGNADNSSIYAGGLVGLSEVADIHDSTADVAVSAQDGDSGTALGGLIGFLDGGEVYNSSSSGDVSIGTTHEWAFGGTGGFVGLNGGTIWNCYATGDVTGGGSASVEVGGFVGYSSSPWANIYNCYARGNVAGGDDAGVGGFVGNAEVGTIQNCYATGNTTGGNDSDLGGFNGDYDSTVLDSCYFNTSATQVKNGSTRSAINENSEDPVGKLDAEMKNDAFKALLNANIDDIEAELDFSAWERNGAINNGFPYLASLSGGGGGGAVSAPANLLAKAGDAQVILNWDPVADVDSYKVYVGTKAGDYSQTLDAAFNSYTVEDLINDTTYYFAVAAVDDNSESEKSDEVKATTFHVAVLEDTTTRKAIATDNITVIVNSNGSYQLQLNPGVSGFYPNSGYQGAYFLFNKNGTTFKQFSELSSTISDFQLSGNAISLKVTDSVNRLEHTLSWEIIGSTSTNSGGYMKLAVTSKNTDTIAHNLGTYMYWDTMINGNDASPFTIISNGWKNFSGNFEISGYFRIEDGTTPADAIFMGQYASPLGLTWTRETRMTWAQQEAAINNSVNAADTAAGAWYDPASVNPDDSRTVSCVFAVNSQTPRINPITAQPGTVNQSTTLQIGVDPAEGASFKYKIFSSVPSIPAPNTTASSITGLVDLVEGSNITGVDATTNKYIGIYEVGDDGNITRFAAKKLFANEIKVITESGGGGGSSSQPSQGTVIVIVNGEQQNAGTETKSTEEGKSVVTVSVDNKIIESRIDDASKNNTTGNANVIQIPVADTKADIVKVELTGDIVKKLETNTFDVSIKRDNVEYIIPAEEFTISKVAENLGVQEKDLGNIKIEVKIAKLDQAVVDRYNAVANANGAELIFPPVAFEIVAKTTKADGTTADVQISKFSNYVERIMEIPAGVDPSKITTGIVFNPDGTYSHVPTDVFQKDGKWYAKLNSLTNSNYSVIWNPVTAKSVENHWAKDAVNDMASRLVILDSEKFEPNKAITRADFAEYIVRALGLYREGSSHENKFKDVSVSGDRTLAILIANEYGVITGYTDGTFKPDQKITREEAMVMYQRAMKVTKLAGSDTTSYKKYEDFTKVSGWAQEYVKEVLSAHVFNGTSATTISPKSNLTYAESAQAIKNLLVESKLINE